MNFTEQELENKIRFLIKEKVIPRCKEIQLLESKDITDIICCNNSDNPSVFLLNLNIIFYLMEE